MKRFWNNAWKFFGILVLVIFAVAGAIGIAKQSWDTTYLIIRYAFTGAMAICGIVGLLVPVQLYFEDRKKRRNNHAAQ
jgi:hypothetical protein